MIQQSIKPQILVVDDFSDDDTLNLLSAFANEYPNLDYISASRNIKGKKQALMDGLAKINTGWVLITDADCKPASKQWAKSMLSSVDTKEIVLGFSPYEKSKGFLNRWIRYEAVLTAIQYFSYSLIGKTYMGVGRNLSYSKKLVQSGEVLRFNLDLQSGDDDLLINHLANDQNVSIQLDPKAWVYSKPKESWGAYFNQKRRHLSTASRYKLNHQFMLLLFSVSWMVLYLSIIFLPFIGMAYYALLLLLLRLLSTYISVFKLFPKLGIKDSVVHWWYLDLCTAVYFLFFSIFAILPQKETW